MSELKNEIFNRAKKFFQNAEAYMEVGETDGALINYKLAVNNYYLLLSDDQKEYTEDIKKNIQECVKWIIPLEDDIKHIRKGRNYLSNNTQTKDDTTNDYKCADIEQGKQSGITFNDLIGFNQMAKKVQNVIVNPLLNPERYPSMSTGMLLYGPPGTGKTMFAKALITQLKNSFKAKGKDVDIAFFTPTGADLKGKYVGETEKNIAKFYRTTKQCLKDMCKENETHNVIGVIFIDECDAIAASRENDESGLNALSVNTLLQMMDGVESDPNIITIGATNEPWKIDSAILRRFKNKQLLPVLGWTDDHPIDKMETTINPNIIKIIQMEIGDFYYNSIRKVLFMETYDEEWQCKMIEGEKEEDWIKDKNVNISIELCNKLGQNNIKLLDKVIHDIQTSRTPENKKKILNLNLCSSADMSTAVTNMIRQATNSISKDSETEKIVFKDINIIEGKESKIKELKQYRQSSANYTIHERRAKDNEYVFINDQKLISNYEAQLGQADHNIFKKITECISHYNLQSRHEATSPQEDVEKYKISQFTTGVVKYNTSNFEKFATSSESSKDTDVSGLVNDLVEHYSGSNVLFPDEMDQVIGIWKKNKTKPLCFSVYHTKLKNLFGGNFGDSINIDKYSTGAWFKKENIIVNNQELQGRVEGLSNNHPPITIEKFRKAYKEIFNKNFDETQPHWHKDWPGWGKNQPLQDTSGLIGLSPYQTAYPSLHIKTNCDDKMSISRQHNLALRCYLESEKTEEILSPLYNRMNNSIFGMNMLRGITTAGEAAGTGWEWSFNRKVSAQNPELDARYNIYSQIAPLPFFTKYTRTSGLIAEYGRIGTGGNLPCCNHTKKYQFKNQYMLIYRLRNFCSILDLDISFNDEDVSVFADAAAWLVDPKTLERLTTLLNVVRRRRRGADSETDSETDSEESSDDSSSLPRLRLGHRGGNKARRTKSHKTRESPQLTRRKNQAPKLLEEINMGEKEAAGRAKEEAAADAKAAKEGGGRGNAARTDNGFAALMEEEEKAAEEAAAKQKAAEEVAAKQKAAEKAAKKKKKKAAKKKKKKEDPPPDIKKYTNFIKEEHLNWWVGHNLEPKSPTTSQKPQLDLTKILMQSDNENVNLSDINMPKEIDASFIEQIEQPYRIKNSPPPNPTLHKLKEYYVFVAEFYVYFAFLSRKKDNDFDPNQGYNKADIDLYTTVRNIYKKLVVKKDTNICDAMIMHFIKCTDLAKFRILTNSDYLFGRYNLGKEFPTDYYLHRFEGDTQAESIPELKGKIDWEENVFDKMNQLTSECISIADNYNCWDDTGIFKTIFNNYDIEYFDDPLGTATVMCIAEEDNYTVGSLNEQHGKNKEYEYYQLSFKKEELNLKSEFLDKWFEVPKLKNYHDIIYNIINTSTWFNIHKNCIEQAGPYKEFTDCTRIIVNDNYTRDMDPFGARALSNQWLPGKIHINNTPEGNAFYFKDRDWAENTDYYRSNDNTGHHKTRNALFCTFKKSTASTKTEFEQPGSRPLFFNFTSNDYKTLFNSIKPTISKGVMDNYKEYETNPSGFDPNKKNKD